MGQHYHTEWPRRYAHPDISQHRYDRVWQQHKYKIVNTHRTVIELASHIQITSNITTTRKHADMQHDRRRGHPPEVPHPPRAIQKYGGTHQLPEHRLGNSRAQGHSNPSHIIAQPRKTGNNKHRTSHRGAYRHNNSTFFFIYWLSWVVVPLSSTCLTINCLHFLFSMLFQFILVFTLDCFNLWFVFGLFYLCLVTHLLTKHVEISTLCARYSLQ